MVGIIPNLPFRLHLDLDRNDFYPKTNRNNIIFNNTHLHKYINGNLSNHIFFNLEKHLDTRNNFKQQVNIVDSKSHINIDKSNINYFTEIAPFVSQAHKTLINNKIILDDEALLDYLIHLIEEHNIEHIISILKSNSNHKYAKFLLVAMIDIKINTSMSMSLLDKEIINSFIMLFSNAINKSINNQVLVSSIIKNTNKNLNDTNKSVYIEKTNTPKIALKLNQAIDTIEKQVKFIEQQINQNNITNLKEQYNQLTSNIIDLIESNSELLISKFNNIGNLDSPSKDNSATKQPILNKNIKQIINNWKEVNHEINSSDLTKTKNRGELSIGLIKEQLTNSFNDKNPEEFNALSLQMLSFFIEKELTKYYLTIDKFINQSASGASETIGESKNILDSLSKFIAEIKSEVNKDEKFSVVYQPMKVNFDDRISVISHTMNVIRTDTQKPHFLLSLPDFPLLNRNSTINKKAVKRKPGENKCPCGSGKELRYCCGEGKKGFNNNDDD